MSKLHKCTKCGTVHPIEMSNCPNCFNKNNNYTKSTILKIAILLAVFVIVFFSVMYIMDNLSDTLSDTLYDETSQSSQVKITSLGSPVHINGLNITLHKVEEWKPTEHYIETEKGLKFLRCYFVIENTTSENILVGSNDFECYVNNSKMQHSIFGDNELEILSDLSGNRTIQGYIYYEIPIDAQNIEIEYKSNHWSDEKAIFLTE